jgi:hypothetical protein
MSFSRRSNDTEADPIWPDSTFKKTGARSAATTQYCIHSFREIKEKILQYYM